MARPVHSLSYPSIFVGRNCGRRRISKRRLSTAAQAADDTIPPPPPSVLSISLLELNRSIIRKSIGAEQLVPVSNAILKPFSNPFAQPPLNYDSLWYHPPSFPALVESHLRVLASYESRTSFLRVSAKRYLYFIKAVLAERALPPDWKCHAIDRVALNLSRQIRGSLRRPRRRRSRAELLHRNERLLVLLNAICAEAEKAGNLPLPQSLVELGLEMAVECRNFQACKSYLHRHRTHCPQILSVKTLKKVLSKLNDPESVFGKVVALRAFRTWTSTHSATLLAGLPDDSESPKLSPLVARQNPECFKLWLQTLAALSKQVPEFKAHLRHQLWKEWDEWKKCLRDVYESGILTSARYGRYAARSVFESGGKAASDLDMCFLESFVQAGAYSDGWTVLFSTHMPFKSLSTSVRRALIEDPEISPPESWTPENEKQLLSIYTEYCRAIEGALGVQWVRDEATGESYHRISTGHQRRAGRFRRRVRRPESRRFKT